jgi:DNA-binding transcriptional regulator YiaG
MKTMQHSQISGASAAELYDAKVLGAPFKVFLTDGFQKSINPVSKKQEVSIEDLGGLIAAVVQARVLSTRKLSGADLKFIRSALCMKSSDLAKVLDLSAEHYSRCESGVKILSGATEKAFRMIAFLLIARRNKELRDNHLSKIKSGEIKVEPQDVEKALSAFQMIFLEMDIMPVYDAGELLEFTFHRKCRSLPAPCAESEGEWAEPTARILARA